MARTSNIFVRVEPEVNEQAEEILDELGIPMSNAVGMFLRQVVLQRGIPFDIKLPSHAPAAFGAVSPAERDAELAKGIDDIKAGRTIPADELAASLFRDYGV